MNTNLCGKISGKLLSDTHYLSPKLVKFARIKQERGLTMIPFIIVKPTYETDIVSQK